jgi:GlpG protein
MRHIGNLPTEPQARLFGDYLYARGIRNEVESDGNNAWMIWVAEEGQLDAARELLERFSRDPAAPEFARGAAGAETVRANEARDLAAYRKRFFTRKQVFPQSPTFGAGVLTYSLIVVCVVVCLFSSFGRDHAALRYLFISNPENDLSGFLPEVRAGEVWRLFTPAIIHFGVPHLLFNMFMLFQLGSMIESRQGHFRFALLTLVFALGSNMAQYCYDYYIRHYVPAFGGMSGVIYGLFGYVWLRGRFDRSSGLYIDRQSVILIVAWFFLCLTGLVGSVANMAHGAGLALGAAWGFISAQLTSHRR